ncbi:hypothetical protein KY345_04520 [Candidatus Woesearchaeota archaeon]|nr:hypothetical protein [Candidatus Woesearchaeota archaeon]
MENPLEQASVEDAPESSEDQNNEYSDKTGQDSDEEEHDIIIDEIVPPPEQFFIDWNNDGINDLVRKDIDRKFYVFPNYGSDENPVYNESYPYEE